MNTQNDDNLTNLESKFISFTSDYGFKATFGNEGDTRFLRKALKAMLNLERDIIAIQFVKSDFIGLLQDSRSGLYDLVCIDEDQNTFIVEMQVGPFAFFMERMKFYALHKFDGMVKKGAYKFDNITPIYCVGILSKSIYSYPEYHNIGRTISQHGNVMDENLIYATIELDKFTLTEAEVKTDLEKLIFTMKNLAEYTDVPATQYPPFWTEEWIQTAIKELDTRQMDSDQLFAYKRILVKNVQAVTNAQNEVKEAVKEAKKEAKEEAILKSIKRGKLTDEEIAEDNEATLEFVQKIRAELLGN
jgi:predicted transposase/invertase (TIGR01784 family)